MKKGKTSDHLREFPAAEDENDNAAEDALVIETESDDIFAAAFDPAEKEESEVSEKESDSEEETP